MVKEKKRKQKLKKMMTKESNIDKMKEVDGYE